MNLTPPPPPFPPSQQSNSCREAQQGDWKHFSWGNAFRDEGLIDRVVGSVGYVLVCCLPTPLRTNPGQMSSGGHASITCSSLQDVYRCLALVNAAILRFPAGGQPSSHPSPCSPSFTWMTTWLSSGSIRLSVTLQCSMSTALGHGRAERHGIPYSQQRYWLFLGRWHRRVIALYIFS